MCICVLTNTCSGKIHWHQIDFYLTYPDDKSRDLIYILFFPPSVQTSISAVCSEDSYSSAPSGVCLPQSDLLWVPSSQGAHQESPGALRTQHQLDRSVTCTVTCLWGFYSFHIIYAEALFEHDSGALGKRTRFQQKFLAQLILEVTKNQDGPDQRVDEASPTPLAILPKVMRFPVFFQLRGFDVSIYQTEPSVDNKDAQ